MTAPEPPAVWWSPRHGLIEASDDPPGYVREPAAPMYWRELPADAVRLVPAADAPPAPSEWAASMRALLGKSVEVALSEEPRVTQAGVLHSFTDDGEVCVRDEDGTFRWCWPNLRCALLAPVPETQETDR